MTTLVLNSLGFIKKITENLENNTETEDSPKLTNIVEEGASLENVLDQLPEKLGRFTAKVLLHSHPEKLTKDITEAATKAVAQTVKGACHKVQVAEQTLETSARTLHEQAQDLSQELGKIAGEQFAGVVKHIGKTQDDLSPLTPLLSEASEKKSTIELQPELNVSHLATTRSTEPGVAFEKTTKEVAPVKTDCDEVFGETVFEPVLLTSAVQFFSEPQFTAPAKVSQPVGFSDSNVLILEPVFPELLLDDVITAKAVQFDFNNAADDEASADSLLNLVAEISSPDQRVMLDKEFVTKQFAVSPSASVDTSFSETSPVLQNKTQQFGIASARVFYGVFVAQKDLSVLSFAEVFLPKVEAAQELAPALSAVSAFASGVTESVARENHVVLQAVQKAARFQEPDAFTKSDSEKSTSPISSWEKSGEALALAKRLDVAVLSQLSSLELARREAFVAHVVPVFVPIYEKRAGSLAWETTVLPQHLSTLRVVSKSSASQGEQQQHSEKVESDWDSAVEIKEELTVSRARLQQSLLGQNDFFISV
ncbi:MAG: hypothetical protein H7A33_04090 [Deltaproteobacteria bacterium]|nr:hypothetical protein [Deltaproteobacteria bacterium]